MPVLMSVRVHLQAAEKLQSGAAALIKGYSIVVKVPSGTSRVDHRLELSNAR